MPLLVEVAKCELIAEISFVVVWVGSSFKLPIFLCANIYLLISLPECVGGVACLEWWVGLASWINVTCLLLNILRPLSLPRPGSRAGQRYAGKFRAIMHEHKRMPLREYHLRDESDHHKTRYSHASIRREEYFVCFNFHRTSSRAPEVNKKKSREFKLRRVIREAGVEFTAAAMLMCMVNGVLGCYCRVSARKRKNESKRECMGWHENYGTRGDVTFCHRTLKRLKIKRLKHLYQLVKFSCPLLACCFPWFQLFPTSSSTPVLNAVCVYARASLWVERLLCHLSNTPEI